MSFRPFIRFGRTGDVVNVCVDTLLSSDRPSYWFEIKPGSEIAAILLRDHLGEKLRTLAREAREEAYAAGYKDGRAKRAKKTWQDSRLGRTDG